MAIEDLNPNTPAPTDDVNTGDGELRNTKAEILFSLPNLGPDPVTATALELNDVPNKLTAFNGRTDLDVIPTAGDYTADQIDYDNATSGLTASDVQAAIDELNTLRQALPFTEFYESAEQTFLDAASSFTVSHGLSDKPTLVQAVLICKIAEAGWSVDNEVAPLTSDTGTGGSFGTYSLGFDSGNLYLAQERQVTISNRGSGVATNITAANWRWILRAWR